MIWLFILLLAGPPRHAVYVSMTEITAVEPGVWEVRCRIFNDDLEDALFHRSGVRPALRRAEEVERSSGLVLEYINTHLEIFSESGEAGSLSWKMGRVENEVLLAELTLRSPDIAGIKNSLLVELFPAQQNVVVLKQGGDQLYYRFDARTSYQEIQ